MRLSTQNDDTVPFWGMMVAVKNLAFESLQGVPLPNKQAVNKISYAFWTHWENRLVRVMVRPALQKEEPLFHFGELFLP